MQNIQCLSFWFNFTNLNTFQYFCTDLVQIQSSYCKTITITGIPSVLVYAHLVAFKLSVSEVTNLSLALDKVIYIFNLISVT